MDKREFHKLLNYLRCHPSEAQQLASVLSGEPENANTINGVGSRDAANFSGLKCLSAIKMEKSNLRAESCQWLSATEAGKQIGKSSSWVRKHLRDGLFKSTRRDERGNYFFKKSEVLADFENYVLNRSRSVYLINN